MTMSAENCYEILGLKPGVSDEVVKQAFRELAKHYHPDRNPGDAEAERRFKLVKTAYESLKDESRRKSYDEWLAFTSGRKQTKKRQWGRLAAILLLLFMGPSVVLYGVAVSDGVSLFSTTQQEPSDIVTESSGASGPLSAVVIESGASEQGKSVAETGEDKTALVAERPPIDVDAAPAMDRAFRAPPASLAPVEQPAPRTDLSELRKLTQSTPDYTQALSQSSPPQSSTSAIDPVQSLPSEQPQQPQSKRDPAVDGDQREDGQGTAGTKSSARKLALLKEPAPADASTEKAFASLPEARSPARQLGAKSLDTFADCDHCPLMSVAKRPAAAQGSANLAISLSEITLAQWNLCVNDGVCSPYRASRGELSSPVTGLSPKNAGAFAAWLSGITGKSYQIVMPLQASNMEMDEDCGQAVGSRRLNGWDWLEDKQRRKCEQQRANGNAGLSSRGFRVARQVQSDG